MSSDPLLQPYQLRRLRLKNRVMTTSHEPADTEDGLPKDRYRAYHEERAKGRGGLAGRDHDPRPDLRARDHGDEPVPYIRALQPLGVRMTVAQRLLGVRRAGNALTAIIGTDYSAHREEREFDQVVVNHGTRPLDDLYFALKPLSRNRGAIDHDALAEGRPQPEGRHEGSFTLWRIGDAVAARNTHASIYDALRLLKDA